MRVPGTRVMVENGKIKILPPDGYKGKASLLYDHKGGKASGHGAGRALDHTTRPRGGGHIPSDQELADAHTRTLRANQLADEQYERDIARINEYQTTDQALATKGATASGASAIEQAGRAAAEKLDIGKEAYNKVRGLNAQQFLVQTPRGSGVDLPDSIRLYGIRGTFNADQVRGFGNIADQIRSKKIPLRELSKISVEEGLAK